MSFSERLRAKAPEMYEALRIVAECDPPQPVLMYDEEGIEGFRWDHPDGREWFAIGDWQEPAPCHPVVEEVLSTLEG